MSLNKYNGGIEGERPEASSFANGTVLQQLRCSMN